MIIARRPALCLVTGGHGATAATLDAIAAAARAGVDLVHVRARQLDDRAILALASAAVSLVQGTATRVVVNDRTDIALASGATGVHLRGDSVPASRVRAIVPDGFLIGRSVHDLAEAIAAEADGACDYLVFGTVFPSGSKPATHPVAGIDALSRVCAAVRLPVLAIGGVSIERTAEIARAGAAGIAAIGLFAEASGMEAVAADVRARFDT